MKKYKGEQIRRIIKNNNPHWALAYLQRYTKSKYTPELISIILVGTSVTAVHGLAKLRLIPSDLINQRLYQLGCFL